MLNHKNLSKKLKNIYDGMCSYEKVDGAGDELLNLIHDLQSIPEEIEQHPLLSKAQEIYKERSDQYGNPSEAFDGIARLWGGYLDKQLWSKHVPLMMILLKIERIKSVRDKNIVKDSLIDIIGYVLAYYDAFEEKE
jgi:hypothetical protein